MKSRNFYLIILALIFMALIPSCGKANGITSGQVIPSPSGYTCFAIIENDEVKGGNCIRESQ